MENKEFFNYVETRAQSGYSAAILVREPGETKFSLLIASETAPSVYGTSESFEFDLLNSSSTGKVMGKPKLEDKEVEFLMHRDNIYRLQNLTNKVLDFMYLTSDYMGWKFTGTIKARPNDATNDVLRGTYTISPMHADAACIMDAREYVQETVLFTNSIPESLDVNTTGTKIVFETAIGGEPTTGVALNVDIKNNQGTSTDFTSTSGSNGEITFKAASAYTSGDHKYAVAYITASKTGYAPWTTTILLKDKA